MLAFQTGTAFLTSVLLARALPVEEYGIYAFWVSVATMLGTATAVGMPQLLVREVAAESEKEQWGRVRGLFRWGTASALVASSVVALLAASVGIALWGEGVYWQGQAALLAFAAVPILALNAVRSGGLRGLHRIVLGLLPERVIRPAILTASVALLLLLAQSEADAELALSLFLAAAVIALVIGTVLLNRSMPVQARQADAELDPYIWARSGITLGFSATVLILHKHLDVVMLGALSTPEAVAIYQIAARIALVVSMIYIAYTMVVGPQVSRLWTRKESAHLQRLLTRGTAGAVGVTLLLIIGLVGVGEQLIPLVFGDAYRAAYQPLLILLGAQLINVAFGPLILVLNMTKHAAVSAQALALSVVLMVVSNLLLIPRFGINGAAASVVITLTILNSYLYVRCRTLVGVDPTILSLIFRPSRT